MGSKFQHWEARSPIRPQSLQDLRGVILGNREFEAVDRLDYGDHGLLPVMERIVAAIRGGERIALYADYDVDGTMSCVSWIWFLQAIGYTNFVPYIPCRFN